MNDVKNKDKFDDLEILFSTRRILDTGAVVPLDKNQRSRMIGLIDRELAITLPNSFELKVMSEKKMIPGPDNVPPKTNKEQSLVEKPVIFEGFSKGLLRDFKKTNKIFNELKIFQKTIAIDGLLTKAKLEKSDCTLHYLAANHFDASVPTIMNLHKIIDYPHKLQHALNEEIVPRDVATLINDQKEKYQEYLIDYFQTHKLNGVSFVFQLDAHWMKFTDETRNAIVENNSLDLWGGSEIKDPSKEERLFFNQHKDKILDIVSQDKEVDANYISEQLDLPRDKIEGVLDLLVKAGDLKSEPYLSGDQEFYTMVGVVA